MPTLAQFKVLRNLADGLEPNAGLRGMSAYGGLIGTLAALHRRCWIGGEVGYEFLTREGEQAMDLYWEQKRMNGK